MKTIDKLTKRQFEALDRIANQGIARLNYYSGSGRFSTKSADHNQHLVHTLQELGLVEGLGDGPDDLAVDNIGYAALEKGTTGRVLVVSPGNPWLERVLSTDRATRLATIDFALPDVLKTENYKKAAAAGEYDLILYDSCRPETMPSPLAASVK